MKIFPKFYENFPVYRISSPNERRFSAYRMDIACNQKKVELLPKTGYSTKPFRQTVEIKNSAPVLQFLSQIFRFRRFQFS